MQEKEMVFLGLFGGVSKKTGKSFKVAYFYAKEETSNTIGYKPFTFFVPESVNFETSDLLKKFVVHYVFAGGQYVFVDSKKL